MDNHTSTITINIQGIKPQCLETVLLEKYNIVVRAGFHCSSCTHHTIGTIKWGGAVRFSMGYTNTLKEVN